MLFKQRFWPGIREGTIRLTFRVWQAARVRAGHSYRTPGGMLEVSAVDEVKREAITEDEARQAGYRSKAELLADLPPDDGSSLFRVAFERLPEGDPRDALASNNELTPAEVEEIARRLARMDAASRHGPWTISTLETIAEHPGVRAAALCPAAQELAEFKRDVRKLKELGLTLSLEVGYRISPRGRAFLDARGPSAP